MERETDTRTQRALTQIDAIAMPHKETTTDKAIKLGYKIACGLSDAGIECRFERKGSLFDADIKHVSDVDILIHIKSGAHPAEAMKHALAMFDLPPFAVMHRDTDGVEVEEQTSALPDAAFDASIVTVCVSMPLRCGPHTLPLDLTMTTKADRNESIEHRIQKLGANVNTGKYDKALQRLRPIIRRLRRKDPAHTAALRASLTGAMNEHTGGVRYALKQLELSVLSHRRTEAVSMAGIKEHELEFTLGVARKRNASLAKQVIVEFLDEIEDVAIGTMHGAALLAALASVHEVPCAANDAPPVPAPEPELDVEAGLAALQIEPIQKLEPPQRRGFDRTPPRRGFDARQAPHRDGPPQQLGFVDRDFVEQARRRRHNVVDCIPRRRTWPERNAVVDTVHAPPAPPRTATPEPEMVSFVFDPADIGASGPLEAWYTCT
jgi:hypothetical protein